MHSVTVLKHVSILSKNNVYRDITSYQYVYDQSVFLFRLLHKTEKHRHITDIFYIIFNRQ